MYIPDQYLGVNVPGTLHMLVFDLSEVKLLIPQGPVD